MFLLEAACGSRPLEHDLVVLLDWVLEHWKSGTEKQFFRQWIHGCGENVAEAVGLVLKLGLLCSQPMPNFTCGGTAKKCGKSCSTLMVPWQSQSWQ